MAGAQFVRTGLTAVTLASAKAPGIKFERCVLNSVTGWLSDLSGVQVADTEFVSAKFERCSFFNSWWTRVIATEASFESADLRSTNLWDVRMRKANLVGADLRSAVWNRADLGNADFYWARIEGMTLSDCELGGARLPDLFTPALIMRGASLLPIEQKPLFVAAASPEERRALVQRAFDGTTSRSVGESNPL
jgi:uncharacterized protein YjbI with pentapeptide repeats